LHSRDGEVHPLSEAQKLAAGIPNAELVILETANHIPLPGNAVWDTYMQTLTDLLAGRFLVLRRGGLCPEIAY
jgi:pimeloyl-ACP methyl ester carboxylesterase